MRTKRPFPQLPYWLSGQGTGSKPAVLRKFGTNAGDLSIEFSLTRRPKLITELLLACVEDSTGAPADSDLIWRMPVSWRMEALLMLAGLAGPQPFSWRVRCRSEACLCESEFELTPDEILSVASGPRETETVTHSIEVHAAVLRRPTGWDQMQWLEQDVPKSEEMMSCMLVEPPLDTLLREGASIESVALAIEGAMESFDPLLGFTVKAVCPECGSVCETAPDLAGAALERLERSQYDVLQDVHRLAVSYHWSESEIVELPDWRRRAYLQLIENGAM